MKKFVAFVMVIMLLVGAAGKAVGIYAIEHTKLIDSEDGILQEWTDTFGRTIVVFPETILNRFGDTDVSVFILDENGDQIGMVCFWIYSDGEIHAYAHDYRKMPNEYYNWCDVFYRDEYVNQRMMNFIRMRFGSILPAA